MLPHWRRQSVGAFVALALLTATATAAEWQPAKEVKADKTHP
jgi:hypothetical protein